MRFVRRCLAILAILATGQAAQADRGVTALPLSAEYCTILRAFTDARDPKCPDVAPQGTLRSVARSAVPPGDPLDERGYFIRFAFDSDALSPAYQSHLTELSRVLMSDAMRDLCLLLIGHTDASGAARYNAALSEKRAHTVEVFLKGVTGVAATRLATAGRGETELLSGLPPEDPRHRRVEILAKPKSGGSCG